ncbi:hypothetical protein [Skermania pinensis]|nr:hypothetical protein [Skermania piniformis]
MRTMGLRPGSDKDTGADTDAFGATNLQARHVVEDGDDIRLVFTGKKGVDISLPVTDPETRDVIRSRLADKSGDDRLFQTNEQGARNYLHSVAPFKLKDLRTYHGIAVAEHTVESMDAPKTKREFQTARRRVGEAVAESRNTPTIFRRWEDGIASGKVSKYRSVMPCRSRLLNEGAAVALGCA